MALNFGVLDQGGPSNFFEGYSQGQEKMQANAMAQQKAAQAQQEFGMRQQEFAAGQADKQRVANAAIVTQRTAAARDAILNARTPDEARAIEKAQHADPYLGPIRRQFGSLEADLADIPNEPTAFDQWKLKQAMGADAFLKQQYRQSQVAGLLGDGVAPASAPTNAMAPAANATPQAAPVANAMAPAAPNVADLVRRRNQALALGETAVATAINSDIERLSKSSETPEVVTMKALGYPLTQAGFQAYRDAQRQERLRTPAEEAQAIRIANASRAPTQPVAPTVTSIQDPTNPSQMISINARDYKGGGLGSPGVIGLTGKTPAATAKQDVVDKGNAQLSSVLDDLRSSYDTLEKAAAIPSTQRGVLSNLASSAQASGLGQALGRMGGTEEQSARDTINSSRMMLLNSIKQATGMSAQQLNSNVELKSWLQAVSDPTQSIETVSKVLGNIEKFVASGGKYSAKKEGAPVAVPGKPAPAAAGVAPPPGFKRD